MGAALDSDLVARAVRGDRAAVARLWEEHRAWLATVLLGNLPGGVDPEDLMQDVAVALVREIHRVQQPGAFRAWLRVIALNTARSAARRQAPRRTRELDCDDPAVCAQSAARERRADEARERLDGVLRIVAGFDPVYREPLLLKTVHGFSQKRIAETLGLPETAIESRLSRARRMLRQELSTRDAASVCPSVEDRHARA